MKWYFKVLSQYDDFKGRARRKEFWMFYLFNLIINLIMIIAMGVFALADSVVGAAFMCCLLVLYSLAIFIPYLAVCVRRLHDTGRSGSLFWLYFVPLAGWIWFVVVAIIDSQQGDNKYGYSPKEE